MLRQNQLQQRQIYISRAHQSNGYSQKVRKRQRRERPNQPKRNSPKKRNQNNEKKLKTKPKLRRIGASGAKGKQSKQIKVDPENVIKDKTTLMIRNVPCKFNEADLKLAIDQKFSDKYDFLNLPLDYNVKYRSLIC